MTLPLTPRILAGAYEYLRTTPPFLRWKLPPAEEVEFHVLQTKLLEADHTVYERTDEHVIRVSAGKIGFTSNLMPAMAHEMIHARQVISKTETPNTTHNAEFHRLAKLVCRYHGWDYKLFV